MRSFTQSVLWALGVCVVLSQGALAAPPRLVFDGKIREIFRARCVKCHGEDEQKAELNLQQYAAAMKGGSGGPAIVPGKPNSSPLFHAITHAEGVEKMPPKSDKIPEEEVEAIRAWISSGAPEGQGSAVRTVAAFPVPVNSNARPDSPVMPEGLPRLPRPPRAHPVTALATSPWAPLLAIAVREGVELRHADHGGILGTLPFSEGIPFGLRFSPDGARLMVAGGRAVQSGKVVLVDVRSGKKLADLGDENDAVLAADWSPDGTLVALGGGGRVVKVFSVADGREVYRIRKHTDWITAIAFSPDGRFLATGDRAGGIHLWEPLTGAIALSLSEHKDAIHALEWRGDSRLLASASEDGSVIVWDAKDGWPAVTVAGGHAVGKGKRVRNGVLFLAWLADGSFSTVGRDRRVRVWNAGGEPIEMSEAFEALPTRIRVRHDGKTLSVGDDRGGLWNLVSEKGALRAEPVAP